MASLTKTTVDGNANTARLDIFVNGALQTFYEFTGTAFVLSERLNDVTLSKDDLAKVVSDIKAWMTMVAAYCSVSYEDFAPHSLEVDDKSNRAIFKLKYDDAMAVHAVVFKNSADIEFKARPELMLTPEQFARFRKVLSAISVFHGPYFFFNGD